MIGVVAGAWFIGVLCGIAIGLPVGILLRRLNDEERRDDRA